MFSIPYEETLMGLGDNGRVYLFNKRDKLWLPYSKPTENTETEKYDMQETLRMYKAEYSIWRMDTEIESKDLVVIDDIVERMEYMINTLIK